MNGYASHHCHPNQLRTRPAEMLRPSVLSGVEKAYNLPRELIDTCNVRTFEPVAVNTAQGQIVKLCLAAVLTGNDVIDLKRGTRRRRRRDERSKAATSRAAAKHGELGTA